MNYREALAWLYATQKFGIKLGLKNTQRLLRALHILEGRALRDRATAASQSSALQNTRDRGLGSARNASPARTPRAGLGGPPRPSSSRIIHVAGTNGKGSVCAMIDSICRAANYRTGLFTSPHLISFRERIRVNGEMIAENDVAHGLTSIRDLVSSWKTHPTFFEITTALALQHFHNARCQIIVLETGMGGRLDATNAITADVSVITPIDLDHQKWLGHSIAEIAVEKAGIIKPGIPVLSAHQPREAARVIKERARESGSPLEFVSEQWTKSRIALRGAHQRANAALAVSAVHQLEPSIPDDAVLRGLQTVEWPARFQIWNERIVIDGAHNPAGARMLAQTWRDEFGSERAVMVVAALREKDAATMIRELGLIASRFILPSIRSVRAVPPSDLAALVSAITPSVPYSIAASTADALSLAENEGGRTLITGSLHFAGEALAILSGEPELLEDCAQ